ncbi:ATP-binding protein [Streptomyces sulfonofaciens]|nr:sensor histidine kinase [Streptomyces sulfonofaciens]
MAPLIQDVLLWAPTGGLVAVGAVALRYGRKAARRGAVLTALRARTAEVERRAAEAERQIAARDEEAAHLAESRLPALVYALQDGTGDLSSAGDLLHRELAGTATGKAYLAVLEQVDSLTAAAIERADAASRAAVQAVTRSVQALVYEQQAAITRLLDTEHDEQVLELVQPIDHTGNQLARRLQILGVLTDMWPGRQRDDVPLLDAVRGGVSRIRDFQRIKVPGESAHWVVGRFVEPVVLAVAELLDNAARHSAPTTPVEVSFLEAHQGVSIEIHDAGPGMAPEARELAARRLAGKDPVRFTELRVPPSFGHLGVGRLAAKYGFRVSVDEEHSVHGGVRAVLHLPRALLTSPPAAEVPEPAAARPAVPPPSAAAPSADRPEEAYPVAEDGLPIRRRSGTRKPPPTRPASVPPSPGSGQSLAAFVRATKSARTSDEETS